MDEDPLDGIDPRLREVLESAARLQALVPDAVLVGGSAAALYAHHRVSFDHDHVLPDLRQRFDAVLEALEAEGDWVTNRVQPGKIILGRLGGIETGVRQLIRKRPLEVADVDVAPGAVLRAPTSDETLRIKAFLIVRRNQTRDYLDVAALADRYGTDSSAQVLMGLDDYYADQHGDGDGVASQLLRQLADPRPADSATLDHLSRYKALAPRWHDWSAVRDACRALAVAVVERQAQLGEGHDV